MKQSEAIKAIIFPVVLNNMDNLILYAAFKLVKSANDMNNLEVKRKLILIGRLAYNLLLLSNENGQDPEQLIKAERARQDQLFGKQDNEIYQDVCILLEEIYELIQEIEEGNTLAADTEAVQVMAVCVRILESDLFN